MRIALAMRGGVSLAIWIGGALAEIDVFRRACLSREQSSITGDRADVYGQLLDQSVYDAVEVDILAGASAGGLNAVLYGVAQICGARLGDVAHSTWVRDGALWELLQPDGFKSISAPLRGDEHFFPVMRCALSDLCGGADAASRAGRVSIELAATLLADQSSPELVNRARFSFNSRQGNLGSGYRSIPRSAAEAETEAGQAALNRLALAARATSSFPGAFEPARIFSFASDPAAEAGSVPVPSFVGEEIPHSTAAELRVNMSPTFPYARWWPADSWQDPFVVIDGGVYDNIPIDRALRAIAQAPASGPSERYLIYLDPEPPTLRSADTDPDRIRTVWSWMPVIFGAKRLQKRAETADDELGLIREHNDAVLANRGRLEALAATLRAGSTTYADLVDISAYAQRRIATDVERIGSLLANPWAELCQPPFSGGDYQPADPAWTLGVKDRIARVYNNPAFGSSLSYDIVAVTEQVQVLLAWTRALEDLHLGLTAGAMPPVLAGEPAIQLDQLPAGLGPVKRALYQWLTMLARARYLAVDTVLTGRVSQPSRSAPLEQLLDESRLRQQELRLPTSLSELMKWDARPDEGLFLEELARSADFTEGPFLLGRTDGSSQTAAPTALAALRRRIVDVSHKLDETIRDGAMSPASAALSEPVQRWNQSLYSQLYQRPWTTASVSEIARLFAVSGIPDTASIVKFARITSDEPVADPEELTTLADGARAVQLRKWLRRLPSASSVAAAVDLSPTELVTADAKLAGNAVQRFGGFALADWRRNDWQWGRRDAATALARIVSEARKPDRTDSESDDEYQARRRRVIDELRESSQRQLLTSLDNDERMDYGYARLTDTVGAQTLDAISPRYRFALASRFVPLVCRGLLPDASGTLATKAIAWAFQLALLKPLGVLLVFAADPIRAASALAVCLACVALLGVSDSPRPLHILYGVFLVVAGVLIGLRAKQVGDNWRGLKRLLDGAPTGRAPWVALLKGAYRPMLVAGSWVLAAAACVAGGVSLYDLIRHWNSGDPHGGGSGPDYLPVPLEAFLAVAVAVYTGQAWLHRRATAIVVANPPAAKTGWLRRMFLGVAAGITLAGVAIGAPLYAHHCGEQGRWTVAVAVVSAALLTALSLAGWVDCRRWQAWLPVGIGVAATAGLLQWLLDVRWDVTRNHGALDLLPVAVWMVLLGATISCLPFREDNYGDPGAVAPDRSRRPSGNPLRE
ncbi:DUF3376 domain-containing protein [Mycolicibacterium aichiense]|uniref:DUF3376 domain-containing protein n=1 Tax=Mycolicibacterium aichiense TaxID=1799 RepID=UPI003D67D2E9